MTDLRTELERASLILPDTGVEFGHLSRRRERDRRVKRLTAGIVALAVATAGSISLYLSFGTAPATIAVGSQTSHYVDERSGWTMDYPSAWHLQVTGVEIFEGSFQGALVANVDHEFDQPDLGPNRATSMWDMRGLPPGLVVIEVREQIGGLGGKAPAIPFREPLDLDAFDEIDLGEHAYGAPQPARSRVVESLGRRYSIWVFLHDVASDADVEAAREVVASMRFAPVEAPTTDPMPSPSPTVEAVDPTITRTPYAAGLEVTCEDDGARVAIPDVQAQPRGMTLSVDNRTGIDQWVAFDGAGSGPTIEPGSHHTIVELEPGEHTVQCFPVESYRQDGVGFTLADPAGHWVPKKLQCADGEDRAWTHGDPVPEWRGYHAEPEEVFDQQFGERLQPGDVVERAGYVANREQPWMRVVRASKVIFVTSFRNYGEGWWDVGDYQGCDEFYGI